MRVHGRASALFAIAALLVLRGTENAPPLVSAPGAFQVTILPMFARADDVNIRSGPSTDFPILRTLDFGARVEVVGYDNGWFEISYGPEAIQGWVRADLLTSEEPTIDPIPLAQPAAQSRCDSNYDGCVPIASDVDCRGGSGNGPAYADGPVRVVGRDIYELDRDGDGWACD